MEQLKLDISTEEKTPLDMIDLLCSVVTKLNSLSQKQITELHSALYYEDYEKIQQLAGAIIEADQRIPALLIYLTETAWPRTVYECFHLADYKSMAISLSSI